MAICGSCCPWLGLVPGIRALSWIKKGLTNAPEKPVKSQPFPPQEDIKEEDDLADHGKPGGAELLEDIADVCRIEKGAFVETCTMEASSPPEGSIPAEVSALPSVSMGATASPPTKAPKASISLVGGTPTQTSAPPSGSMGTTASTQAATPEIEPGTTFMEKARILFSQLDKNGDGKVTKTELKVAMMESSEIKKALNVRTFEDCRLFVGNADTDQDGVMSFEEFMAALACLPGSQPASQNAEVASSASSLVPTDTLTERARSLFNELVKSKHCCPEATIEDCRRLVEEFEDSRRRGGLSPPCDEEFSEFCRLTVEFAGLYEEFSEDFSEYLNGC